MMDLLLALCFAWLIMGGAPTYVRDTRTRAGGPMKARAREHGTSSVSWWALGALSGGRYVLVSAWRGWGSHRRWAKRRLDAYRAEREAAATRPDDPPVPPKDTKPNKAEAKPVPASPIPPPAVPAAPTIRLVPVTPSTPAHNGGTMATEMITEAHGYEEILAAFEADVDRLEEADAVYEQRMNDLRGHNADDDTIEDVSRMREANEIQLAAAREARDNWVSRHGSVYDVKTATGARGDEAMYGT